MNGWTRTDADTATAAKTRAKARPEREGSSSTKQGIVLTNFLLKYHVISFLFGHSTFPPSFPKGIIKSSQKISKDTSPLNNECANLCFCPASTNPHFQRQRSLVNSCERKKGQKEDGRDKIAFFSSPILGSKLCVRSDLRLHLLNLVNKLMFALPFLTGMSPALTICSLRVPPHMPPDPISTFCRRRDRSFSISVYRTMLCGARRGR